MLKIRAGVQTDKRLRPKNWSTQCICNFGWRPDSGTPQMQCNQAEDGTEDFLLLKKKLFAMHILSDLLGCNYIPPNTPALCLWVVCRPQFGSWFAAKIDG